MGFGNIDEEEDRSLKSFVSITRILPLDTQVALKTIEIRKRVYIKLPDAVIAATAIVYGLSLITRNVDDFKNINGMEVINPWDL